MHRRPFAQSSDGSGHAVARHALGVACFRRGRVPSFAATESFAKDCFSLHMPDSKERLCLPSCTCAVE
jgi:hypothetical protein